MAENPGHDTRSINLNFVKFMKHLFVEFHNF